MSCKLRSDNLGNRIKCIECLNEINNDVLSNNIMSIINILCNNGFKNLICNYVLNGSNIDNKILNKLYNFINKLNNNNNNDNDITNLCELNNDVLTRIISNLDNKSIVNFEVTCRQACYVSRQPICLSNNSLIIRIQYPSPLPRGYFRFKRIKGLILHPPLLVHDCITSIIVRYCDYCKYSSTKYKIFSKCWLI